MMTHRLTYRRDAAASQKANYVHQPQVSVGLGADLHIELPPDPVTTASKANSIFGGQ